MKISNRLKLIASFVDDDSNIIDVGCDHALLDIYLVQTKKNINAIASDINQGPLESAKKNIENYNLETKIKVKLGDGINTIDETTDTIVISGLGGETIIEILTSSPNKLKNIKTIIVSPHSAIYEVRTTITNLGFKIENEVITYDQNKPYIIIKFKKGQSKYTEEELFFGPILLKNKTEYFYKYYQELNNTNKKLLKTIPSTNEEIIKKLQEEIKRLDKILKV